MLSLPPACDSEHIWANSQPSNRLEASKRQGEFGPLVLPPSPLSRSTAELQLKLLGAEICSGFLQAARQISPTNHKQSPWNLVEAAAQATAQTLFRLLGCWRRHSVDACFAAPCLSVLVHGTRPCNHLASPSLSPRSAGAFHLPTITLLPTNHFSIV